ncbi:hypothetical protein Ndes2526B_g03302 [Nannochloris sp. 'desiccata']|nr:hypothetical protein KSW81_006481 [Chlorella desiccata (nom. nud.)]
MDEVHKKWAEVELPTASGKNTEDQAKIAAARKQIIKVVNWDLNDDKHRKSPQIKDTVTYLRRILENIRDNPTEKKYRKIRITNATFGKHVRDAPGGEAFLIQAGWHAAVVDHERYFIFESQPDTLQWSIFEEACKELAKLDTVLDAKLGRNSGDKKAEIEKRREAARIAIEEDKELRHARFKYTDS